MKHGVLATVLLLMLTGTVFAQQRPLLTEDPETIGGGRLLVEGGLQLDHNVYYPVSGLRGHRVAVPAFGVSIGLSSIAELQIDGGLYQRLTIEERRPAPLSGVLAFEGNQPSDVEDFIIATKLRFFTESGRRPAFGVRLATKLPNASNEKGLGTDMTDFYASLLFAKTIESTRVVANAGVAIIGDATARVPEQNDMLTFGASIARAMTTEAELVGEVHGRLNVRNSAPDPGAENRAEMRLGGRYTRGPVRVDAAVIFGMTSRDPTIGLSAGFTWVLNAFQVP